MRLELVDLSLIIGGPCPWLEWNFVQLALRHRRRSAAPAAGFLSWDRTEDGLAICPPRSRRCRCGRLASAPAASPAALSPALLALLALLRCGRSRLTQRGWGQRKRQHCCRCYCKNGIHRPDSHGGTLLWIDNYGRLSWHRKYGSSSPGIHSSVQLLVHGFVYAPGSSMVTSYFIVFISTRVNFSIK